MNKVLRVDAGGLPVGWLNANQATHLMFMERVLWSMGEPVFRMRGGRNAVTAERSIVEIPSIIATTGMAGVRFLDKIPALSNRSLFARDDYLCLYCGEQFSPYLLSRDHVFPRARGGQDEWTNVVTACKRCNNHKACRTPAEANMPLLAVPYTPNHAEWLALRNHRILADQMDFLRARF